MAASFDIALRWDAAARRFDVAIDGRDIARDSTPATGMVLALGCDRRAHPDDTLPDDGGADPGLSLNPGRGWVGDALDAQGRRLGSRLWLLERAKATEETRKLAKLYAEEGLAGLAGDRGASAAVSAEWLRPGLLALLARLGASSIEIRQAVRA